MVRAPRPSPYIAIAVSLDPPPLSHLVGLKAMLDSTRGAPDTGQAMSQENVEVARRTARLFVSRVRVALVFALPCMALAGPVAEASFPGRNGVIAFTREAPSRGEGAFTIWIADPSSGRTRQLTHVSRRCAGREKTWVDADPSYSASGRLIVFGHEDACDPRSPDGIYVMRSDGTGRRLVLPDLRNKWRVSPALSPDERWLAFSFEYEHRGHEAFITSFPSPGRARSVVRGLPRYDDQIDLAWSADGRLALQLGSYDSVSWGHIATVAPNGKRLRLVTRSTRDRAPDWSPTGRRIVFARERPPSLGITRFGSDVFVARAGGRIHHAPRRLTYTGDAFSPVWSPNGRYIAYLDIPDALGSIFSSGSLRIMRATDGQGQRLVARHVLEGRFSWQPRPRR